MSGNKRMGPSASTARAAVEENPRAGRHGLNSAGERWIRRRDGDIRPASTSALQRVFSRRTGVLARDRVALGGRDGSVRMERGTFGDLANLEHGLGKAAGTRGRVERVGRRRPITRGDEHVAPKTGRHIFALGGAAPPKEQRSHNRNEREVPKPHRPRRRRHGFNLHSGHKQPILAQTLGLTQLPSPQQSMVPTGQPPGGSVLH